MVARTQLAAIDHNNNSERKQAVLQSEPQQGKARHKTSVAKGRKQWVVKPIKEEKGYGYVDRLIGAAVHACQSGERQVTPWT